MSRISTENRTATILFRIVHVSNLLNFEDMLSKKIPPVALIIALLKLDHPEILYMGYDYADSPAKDKLLNAKDAAIIRICLPGKDVIRRSVSKTMELFIKELEKPRNIVTIASKTLDKENAVIGVSVTVESVTHRNKYNSDCAVG